MTLSPTRDPQYIAQQLRSYIEKKKAVTISMILQDCWDVLIETSFDEVLRILRSFIKYQLCYYKDEVYVYIPKDQRVVKPEPSPEEQAKANNIIERLCKYVIQKKTVKMYSILQDCFQDVIEITREQIQELLDILVQVHFCKITNIGEEVCYTYIPPEQRPPDEDDITIDELTTNKVGESE